MFLRYLANFFHSILPMRAWDETPAVQVNISGDGARMCHSSSLLVCLEQVLSMQIVLLFISLL